MDQPGFSGNPFFYGFENENKREPPPPQLWPDVRLDSMARAAAALCQAHGWNENRVIGHKEWTKRKSDPEGFKMADFRVRVAIAMSGIQPVHALNEGEENQPTTDRKQYSKR